MHLSLFKLGWGIFLDRQICPGALGDDPGAPGDAFLKGPNSYPRQRAPAFGSHEQAGRLNQQTATQLDSIAAPQHRLEIHKQLISEAARLARLEGKRAAVGFEKQRAPPV